MEDYSLVDAETVVEVSKVLQKREFNEDDPLEDGFRKAEFETIIFHPKSWIRLPL